ncbi:MAG: hypothetical protein AB1798_14445 [Spirochaetota bacterium]
MTVTMNGKLLMEWADPMNVHNVRVRIYTGLNRIGVTRAQVKVAVLDMVVDVHE